MKINLNYKVRVKLNDLGREIHKKEHDDYPEYEPPEEDENGWSEWQLWTLMRTFGPHMNLGVKAPFKTTIEIDDRNRICPRCHRQIQQLEEQEKRIKILVGCQIQSCAEEVSYHLDMVKMWKQQPICQSCFEEHGPTDDDGEPIFDWHELPDVSLENLSQ